MQYRNDIHVLQVNPAERPANRGRPANETARSPRSGPQNVLSENGAVGSGLKGARNGGCEGAVLTEKNDAVNFKSLLYADVAQLVEQRTCNARVGGSNPFIGSFPKYTYEQR